MSEATNTPAQVTPDAGAPVVKDGAEAIYGKDGTGDKTPAAAKDASIAAAPTTLVTEPPKVDAPKPTEPVKPLETKAPEPNAADPAAPKAEGTAPATYELKMPEGSTLPAEHVEALKAYAKEKGLSNEQAQELLQRESAAVDTFKQSQSQLIEQKKTSWIEASQADKEFGGDNFPQNVELAKRALNKFGSDALKKELDSTGLGNHPELLRAFYRVGKQMADDSFVRPGGSTPQVQRPIEDIFYPQN